MRPAGFLECSLTLEILGLPLKLSSGIPRPDGRAWTASAGTCGHCHCPGHTPQPPSPAGASCCRAILTVTRMSTSRSRNPGMPAPLRTRDRLPRWSQRVGTVPHGLLVATVVGSPGSCESKATARETENGAPTLHGEGAQGCGRRPSPRGAQSPRVNERECAWAWSHTPVWPGLRTRLLTSPARRAHA